MEDGNNQNPFEAKSEENTQNNAESTVNAQQAADKFTETVNNINNTADTTDEFDPADIQNNKVYAIFCYIGWLFWLIGFLVGKDSKFVRFHANQGLVINLFMLLSFIPVIGWIWALILFVFAILGLVNAAQGKAKEVPVLGGIKIIK